MANYANLKATINANIKANGNEEITGPILNTVLNQAVTTLGAGYQYMGVATPATSPGTPDANVFYIAATPGTYTNFGGKVVADGEVAILKYNGSWTKEVSGAATAAQVTQLGQKIGMFSDDSLSDFALADENGRDILRLQGGHITVKKFSSIKPGVVVVAKSGGDYTTIAEAVNGTNNGDTILIYPGVYEEAVEMFGKERHLVGVCKDTCILTNGTGNYDTPPLEANIGSVSNLTIIADNYAPTTPDPSINNNNAAYGIHIEYANSTPYTFAVRNCKILAKWSAGIGLGLRYNQTVIIEDSELISESVSLWSEWSQVRVEMGGLFFHNDASSNTSGTGKLIVSNTRLTGKKAALVMESVENKPGTVDAEFIGCTLKSVDYGVTSSVIYRWPGTTTPSGKLCGSKIVLVESSHGNNNTELNSFS